MMKNLLLIAALALGTTLGLSGATQAHDEHNQGGGYSNHGRHNHGGYHHGQGGHGGGYGGYRGGNVYYGGRSYYGSSQYNSYGRPYGGGYNGYNRAPSTSIYFRF